MSIPTHVAEQNAAAAFSRQAPLFDELYGGNAIIHYKRKRVRAQVEEFLSPHSFILELNCGTGSDALYFAQAGHDVLATDISSEMLGELERKSQAHPLAGNLRAKRCSYHELANIAGEGPFDFIFSNFGGLNCTGHLNEVLQQCDDLLKPGGIMTLVVIPPFCLWESLLLLKGEWRTATRRWFRSSGTMAQVEGQSFRCWYYKPVYIRKALGGRYEQLALEGLCTIVPPSYREQFPRKFPRLLRRLQWLEDRVARRWPFRGMGDYFIMTLRKKVAEV